MKSVVTFLAALLVLILASCEKETALNIHEVSLSYPDTGGSKTVSLTANKPWTVISDQSWCKVSPRSGETASSSKITIACDANTSYDERNCTVTFSCAEVTKTVSVTQAANNDLIVSQTTYELTKAAQQLSIQVQANVKYSVEVDASCKDWITYKTTKGLTTNTVVLDIAENKTYDSREGKVTIKQEGGTLSSSITIMQTQLDGLLISQTSYELTKVAQQLEIPIQANVEFSVEVGANCRDWITYKTTKGLTTNTVVLDIAENITYDIREGNVTIKQEGGSLSSTITIKQSQLDGLFISTPEYSLSNEQHTLTVEVSTNVEFEVIPGAEWVKFVQTKGLNSKQIILEVAENDTFDRRETTVSIKQKNGELSGTIQIKQDEKYGIFVSQSEYNLTNEAQTIDIEVKYNVDFNVVIPDECKDWVSVIGTKGLTSITYAFSVAKNESYGNRECAVTFKQKTGDLSGTFVIKQFQTDALIVGEKEYHVSCLGESISVEVNSNVDFEYEITEGLEWISGVKTKALTHHTIQFEVLENKTVRKRTGKIRFYSLDAGLSEEVVIVQDMSTEAKALLAILEACEDENWKQSYSKWGNWGTDQPLDTWKGVVLNANGFIDSLDLGSYIGNIPDAIGDLQELRYFRSTNVNDKLASFPSGLCRCLKLEEIHFYTGAAKNVNSIPEDIAHLQNLRVLNLGPCSIESFPQIVCKLNNLEELVFGGGITSIPRDITNLKRLRIIHLSSKNLTSFPLILCQCTSLEEIRLEAANMEGTLPEEIGNLKNLYYLGIAKAPTLKPMRGDLPKSLFSLPCWKRFPFDILIHNDFNCKVSDFVAPDFNLYASDGTHLFSEQIYQNHKYTILLNASMSYSPLLDDLKEVQKKYPNDIAIVSFFTAAGVSSSMDDFINSYGITWPCVRMNRDLIISGGDGHSSLWGRTWNTNAVMAIDHAGKVVFFTGYNDSESILQFLTGEGYYESRDYSADGKIVELQKATDGKGIDLVFMGDGYTDRLIEDGTYFTDMKRALDAFFCVEPYKSFRHLFNAYCIFAVSKNDRYDKAYGTQTVFNVDVTPITGLKGDIEKVRDYALKALGGDNDRLNHTTIITVINSQKGRSICSMGDPYAGYSSECFCVKSDLEYTVVHEAGGHGFAYLADEYVDEIIASDYTAQMLEPILPAAHTRWQYRNIDITDDPSRIVWSHFLVDPRYTGQVGIYEGGFYLSNGVFRPAKYSIMNNGQLDAAFNAPSREAIYYRIHKMAFGELWVYNYEDFVKYDAINRNNIQTKSMAPHDTASIRNLTAPPIVKYIAY